jgi:hypothetical protein
MKNNITNILTEAIGKLAKGGVGMSPDEILGYNIAKAELRAKIPAIQEAIIEEINELKPDTYGSSDYGNGWSNASKTDGYLQAKQDIINHLTK